MTTYVYDALNRLKEANYSNGDYYHHTYDAVGNRLSQTISISGQVSTINYVYDDANRLTDVNGVTYVYDNNGNLLSDGVNTYTYDSANRLKNVSGQSSVSSFQYNGLGDRLSQTVNGITTTYTLDLNAGLTQVLNDGTNAYIYGVGRIAQVNTTIEYFLGDALGSVRQLVNSGGTITLAKSYTPYGETRSSAGSGTSPFAFTGEQVDASGLTYLRSRYYANGTGRFLTRDTWEGDYHKPLSLHRWAYVNNDPINKSDPSGLCSASGWHDAQGLFTQANCNALEADLANGTTSFTEAWYRLLANRERKDGLIETSAALEYFLDGTGGERQLSSDFVKDTVEVAMPEIHDDISDLVKWYIQKNFGGLANCNLLNIGPDTYTAGGYTTNYAGIALGVLDRQQEAAGTMGSFRVDVELSGSLTKNPILWFYRVDAEIVVHVIILDVYNWNKGAFVYYPPRLSGNQIMDEWANNLEKNGTAKSYIHRGDYTYIDTRKNAGGPGWFFDANNPPSPWLLTSCIGSQFDKDAEGPGQVDYCGKSMRSY